MVKPQQVNHNSPRCNEGRAAPGEARPVEEEIKRCLWGGGEIGFRKGGGSPFTPPHRGGDNAAQFSPALDCTPG